MAMLSSIIRSDDILEVRRLGGQAGHPSRRFQFVACFKSLTGEITTSDRRVCTRQAGQDVPHERLQPAWRVQARKASDEKSRHCMLNGMKSPIVDDEKRKGEKVGLKAELSISRQPWH